MTKSQKVWDLSWFHELWESLCHPPQSEEHGLLNSIGTYAQLLDSKGVDYQNLHIVTVIEKGENAYEVKKTIREVILKRTNVLAYKSYAWKCKLHDDNYMLVWIGGAFDRLFCCACKTLKEAEKAFEAITSAYKNPKIKEKMKNDET